MLYEESAGSTRAAKESKLYTLFKVFAIIFFVLAGIVALTFFMTILDYILVNFESALARLIQTLPWVFLMLLFGGTGLVFWFLKNRFNVGYDYIFVQDELRITKVFNGKKRKFLTTIHADQILKLGWADRDSYEDTLRGLGNKKPKIFTPNRAPAEGKEFIYIFVSGSIEKSLYVIECRQTLLEYLVYAAGRNKLEQR